MEARRIEPTLCRSDIDHGLLSLAAQPSADVANSRNGLPPLNEPAGIASVSIVQYTEKAFVSCH